MQRRRFLAVAAGMVGVLAGCAGGGGGGDGGGSGDVARTNDVALVSSQFDPRNIHVAVGTTVTWTNENGIAHTVTSASENWSFDTEVAGGESTEFTFEEAGVYDVYCRFHGSADLSGMSMKVGVDATIEEPLGGGQQGGGGY